jgi:hypothetical protein
MGIILLQGFVDPVVPPIGADGTLLALQPEVGSNYAFEYRTDIHKSWDGRERRISLLGYPRESFEAEFLIDDEETFRALRFYRTQRPTDPYLMVMWHEGITAQGEVTGDVVRWQSTYVDWAVVGRRVWVEGPGGTGYSAVIQTVTAGSPYATYELDEVPPGSFADGSVIVYPLRAYYLEDASPMARHPVAAGTWSVRGRAVEPFTTIGTGATVNTLGGTPLLEPLPIVRGAGAEDRPDGNVDMLDAGARVQPEWSFSIADILRQHDFQVGTIVERQYWKAFFHAIKGRQKVFLLPTYRNDFDAIAVAGANITAYYDTEASFTLFGGHNWVRIVDTSGALTTHEVLSSAQDVDGGGNAVVYLTLSPSPPALANIAEIQWIEKVRLVEDRVVWNQVENGRQQMTLRFVVVRQ